MRSSQLSICCSYADVDAGIADQDHPRSNLDQDHRIRNQSSNRSRHRLLTGFGEMVCGYVAKGWQPFLITFMFNKLSGPPSAIISQMRNEVERVYSTFLTRVVRDPASPKSVGRLPILISSADLPVRKRSRPKLQEVSVNDGLHFNGVLLVPTVTRLRTTVEAHFNASPLLYLKDRTFLDRIDVRPITSDPAYVTDYVFKSVKNNRLTYDDAVLVLPKAISEISEHCRDADQRRIESTQLSTAD